jgi:hypothetical protein
VERVIVDDVAGGSGSHVMLLPGVDAQYRLQLSVTSVRGEVEGAVAAAATTTTASDCDVIHSEEKLVRTLPYVNCES